MEGDNIQTKNEENQINQHVTQEDANVLDAQTLENLAAFLSRDVSGVQPKMNNESKFNNQTQVPAE